MGLLLYAFGIIGLLAAAAFLEFNISIFNLTNLIFIVVVVLVLTIMMALVASINQGAAPLSRRSIPIDQFEHMRSIAGGIATIVLSYQFFIRIDPLEGLVTSLLAILLTSLWLISLSWLFGGILGVRELRQE